MEEMVKERIKEVLSENSMSITQLANQFNVNQKTLNNQINDTTTLSVSTILLILKAYPDLSAEWLLRGTGKKMIQPSADVTADDEELIGLSRDLVRVIGKIMDKTNKR